MAQSIQPTEIRESEPKRFAACIEYVGSAYHGWQKQVALASVQAEVERALSRVANHPIDVVCAGRTDAGVHSTGQVIHFDSSAVRSEHAWLCGANSFLPRDISLQWVKQVDTGFHARFSAVARRYQYFLYCHPARPALFDKRVTWYCRSPLDLNAMQEAVSYLVGEHDFSAFRAKACQAHSPIRTVEFFTIQQAGQMIVFDICANAFLHHMVRNFVGTLLEIGQGSQAPSWIKKLLASKERMLAGVTAPAEGLYLVGVRYPGHFCLHTVNLNGLDWLSSFNQLK